MGGVRGGKEGSENGNYVGVLSEAAMEGPSKGVGEVPDPDICPIEMSEDRVNRSAVPSW